MGSSASAAIKSVSDEVQGEGSVISLPAGTGTKYAQRCNLPLDTDQICASAVSCNDEKAALLHFRMTSKVKLTWLAVVLVG
jgi:hypothetical protein